MPVIVVANPKGGVGKSTLSTNLAGYFARRGHAVMLGDVDPQESSRTWLSLRPAQMPRVSAWTVEQGHVVRPPKGTTHVVLDTPAGLNGRKLDEVMRVANKVIVPLLPSIFDIYATRSFLNELAQRRRGELQVGIVGNRVREGTIAADQLQRFVQEQDLPVISYLRDTQNYVHLAARGLSLWDIGASRVARDLEQWEPVLDWLDQA
jgi:chromosome partitioning protein